MQWNSQKSMELKSKIAQDPELMKKLTKCVEQVFGEFKVELPGASYVFEPRIFTLKNGDAPELASRSRAAMLSELLNNLVEEAPGNSITDIVDSDRFRACLPQCGPMDPISLKILEKLRIRRDVAGDHAARADDTARADGHPGAEDGAAAHPHVRADVDGFGELPRAAQAGIEGVGGGVDLHGRAEHGVVADGDRGHVEHHAVEVEEHPLAEQDVDPVVAEERRLQSYRVAVPAEQLPQEAAAFLRHGLAGRVQILAEVPRPVAPPDQFHVMGIVQLPADHLFPCSRHCDSDDLPNSMAP